MAEKIRKGDTVSVHYTGRLTDGNVFDSSEGRDPLTFTVGQGQIISGFEDAVVGMAAGECKTVTIDPEQGYGQRRDELLFEFPRDQVPEGMQIEVGTPVQLQDNSGNPVPAVVAGMTDALVTMDCNHPLAGKTLEFDITVVETGAVAG